MQDKRLIAWMAKIQDRNSLLSRLENGVAHNKRGTHLLVIVNNLENTETLKLLTHALLSQMVTASIHLEEMLNCHEMRHSITHMSSISCVSYSHHTKRLEVIETLCASP